MHAPAIESSFGGGEYLVQYVRRQGEKLKDATFILLLKDDRSL